MDQLLAISTFGWYTESLSSDLMAISTFGWWSGEVVIIKRPDLYCMTLYRHDIHTMELCR